MIAVLVTLAVASSPGPPRYLIAVGHNRGLPSEATLRYAERDAARFADVMQRFGGVDANHSVTLVAPTPEYVEATIDGMIEVATAAGHTDALLLFYYSGHADETDLHLADARWSRSRLGRKLAEWPGRLRVAVVDACRSLSDVQIKGFSKVPRFRVDVAGGGGLQGRVTLRSSSAGEAAQESEQLQGSVYTHYLLTGLRGAADEDDDRRVTLEEAYLFAYRNTVRRSAAGPGNVMHPSVRLELKGVGALVLTETEPRTAMLLLPAEPEASYFVYRRPQGQLIAEVRSSTQKTTRLAVAPGDYLLQRRWRDERTARQLGAAREVTVGESDRVRVNAREFASAPVDLLAAKGGLFRIWGQALTVTGGGLLSHATTFGPRLRLRYGLARGEWLTDLSVEVGRFEDDDSFNRRTEQWVGGDVRVGRRGLLGPFALSLGLAWRVVDQSLERKDGDLLQAGGLDAQEQFVGFAAGPTLGLATEWAITPSWFVRANTSGTGFIRREGDSWVFRPEVGASVGLGRSF